MSRLFSDELYAALLSLDEGSREAVVARLTKRVRSSVLYEALTIALGPLGAHRLYLGDWLGALTRCCLVALMAGFAFLAFWKGAGTPLLAAGAIALYGVALWSWDYFRRNAALSRYHKLLERRALETLSAGATAL